MWRLEKSPQRNIVHQYANRVIKIIAECNDPWLDNINFPINDYGKLKQLESGFASISKNKIRGTVAAGDGIVFRMIMPTNEEVDYDVKSYFT